MIEGIFALQISRETVPDLAIANIDFLSKCPFSLSSLTTSQLSVLLFLIYE